VVTTLDAKQSKPSSSSPLEALGVTSPSGALYEVALTHRSFAFENELEEHNERLEFLGDAVLQVVVTDLIFNRYPDLAEGEMARLRASVVNTNALAGIAAELGIGEIMRLGKGEESSGGRLKLSLLANAFEAVIGALYLDLGIEHAARYLTPLFEERLESSIRARSRYDAKTALQEVAVRTAGSLPSYRVAASGPDHDKQFVAHVYIEDEQFGSGSGKSKKEAEHKAATEALMKLQNQRDESGSDDARAS
jgi:ribonuclease III